MKKQFRFPISIPIKNNKERIKCVEILQKLGYKIDTKNPKHDKFIITQALGNNGIYNYTEIEGMSFNRYILSEFNPDLIKDIASSLSEGDILFSEPTCFKIDDSYLPAGNGDNIINNEKNTQYRRPTIEEICNHYGYELDGMKIIKKENNSETKKILTNFIEWFTLQSKYQHITDYPDECIKDYLESIKEPKYVCPLCGAHMASGRMEDSTKYYFFYCRDEVKCGFRLPNRPSISEAIEDIENLLKISKNE